MDTYAMPMPMDPPQAAGSGHSLGGGSAQLGAVEGPEGVLALALKRSNALDNYVPGTQAATELVGKQVAVQDGGTLADVQNWIGAV